MNKEITNSVAGTNICNTMEPGNHFKNGVSLKNHRSRGNRIRLICIALLASIFIFSGCKKEIPKTPGKATSRYETVPYLKSAKSGLDNLVFYDCDEEYNYYFFVLGYVRSTPLAYRDAYYYNGVTSLTIKYSRSDITQETISKSVVEAYGHSSTVNHSTNYNNELGFSAGFGANRTSNNGKPLASRITSALGINFEASYKHSWGGSDGTSETNSRSFSNTYETSLSNTTTSTTEESYIIGNKGEPAGMYRWSLFSTTDVYCVVITDRANPHYSSGEEFVVGLVQPLVFDINFLKIQVTSIKIHTNLSKKSHF